MGLECRASESLLLIISGYISSAFAGRAGEKGVEELALWTVRTPL